MTVSTKSLLTALTAAMPAAVNSANNNMPFVRMQDLQGVANPEKAQWAKISKDVQFLPVDDLPTKTKKNVRRSLEQEYGDGDGEDETGAWEEFNPYSVQPFVEGMEEYDEYQQAWRLLGFMIDCNFVDDYEESHASEEVTEDGCARYILWAAYVDLEYEGGGIGEYQYYNRTTKKWDTTACDYAEHGSGDHEDEDGGGEGSRCAKMDCHLDDTHFSLLGFFKHRSYDDWMEQLFKHEGMCVWTEEEYAFMKNARKAWPSGCVYSYHKTEDGEALYYNVKPMSQGRIGIGLYTDSQCVEEYSSDVKVVENLLGNLFVGANSHDSGDYANYDFSSETFSESMDRWNSAFDVWHMCHPCVAHDLENTAGDKYLYNDDYYYNNDDDDDYNYNGGRKRRGRKLGGEYSAEGDIFECYDDAGYTNVNQCMKFSAKTYMETATFRDLSLGRTQGTLVQSPLTGFLHSKGKYRRELAGNFFTYLFFILTSLALCFSMHWLYKTSKETKYDLATNLKESLLTEKKQSRKGELA